MNNLIILVFIFNLLLPDSLGSFKLDSEDYHKLTKIKTKQHILYETYLGNKDNNGRRHVASVFGYHYDTFLNNNLFYSIAIFGAIGGERGGYGIAMLGSGYEKNIKNKISYQVKGLFGSGGGGGLSAGGGVAFSGQIGLSYELSNRISLISNFGYLKFPSGSFETSTLNIGLSYNTSKISLPY